MPSSLTQGRAVASAMIPTRAVIRAQQVWESADSRVT